MTAAIVFDLDGVIVDTEQVWDEVREELVADWGGRYSRDAQQAMMGMSSGEWSRYMHDELGLEQSPREINDEVVRRMLERYRLALPLIEGAVDVVRDLSRSFPLAVASSSNRSLIDTVLETAGIADCFSATVSSEEVERGKPSPDVYLEAARRLGVVPQDCVAVEDSRQRNPRSGGRGHARDRVPEPALPARFGCARPGRRGDRLTRRPAGRHALMWTGEPSSARRSNLTMSAFRTRRHPCETAKPIMPGAFVP